MSSTRLETLPRTLVVSEAPFSLRNGFGVTLATLFAEWPHQDLFQLYARAGALPSRELCERVRFADVPGHWGRRYGIELLFGCRPTWRGHYSAAWLRRTLDGWRPAVVYSLVYSGETLAFAEWISNVLDCPLVAHVADDGLEILKSGVACGIRALLSGATARISISEEMRAEYDGRYCLDSEVLHNGAAEELFAGPVRRTDDNIFRVRYLGSLVPGHHFNAIEDVAEAVRMLGPSGVPARFELYGGAETRQPAERLLGGDHIIHCGEVSKTDGFNLLKTADLLVVPVNFDPDAFAHVRLSLPTKLVEFLASGTPTLVYGPDGCAPVEFCRRHDVGSVITTRSVEHLLAHISRLATDPAAARARAEHDRAFIHEHYSATVVQRKFRSILQRTLRNHP